MRKLLKTLIGISAMVGATSQALGRDLPCHEDGFVDAERSMVITDLSVVNDARAHGTGAWSFGRAMVGSLGGSADLGPKTYRWLDQFGSLRSLNGFALRSRTPGGLLENWPRTGSSEDNPSFMGKDLDLTKAPFRLLAIAFRIDEVGAEKPAGEGRLIFGATHPGAGTKNLTVIFEFKLPVGLELPNGDHTSVAFWYEQIARLSLIPFGDEYNRRLQALTNLFVVPRDGRSHISQVRTNEQYFGPGWDFREFHLDSARGELKQMPVAQTPDTSLNTRGQSELVSWVQANSDRILEGNYVLPERFRGGSSFLEDDRFAWFKQNPAIDENVRREFGMKTCGGCHGRETRTRFLHIAPRLEPDEAELSRYLKSIMKERATILQRKVCGN